MWLLALFLALQVPNVTVRVQWSPNAPSNNVTSYALTVDGGTPIIVQPSACSPTTCEQSVTTTFAIHTFSLTATNQWGTSLPAIATEDLSIPSPPANFRIVR